MKPTLYNALSRGMIVAASGWLLAACAQGRRPDGTHPPFGRLHAAGGASEERRTQEDRDAPGWHDVRAEPLEDDVPEG